MVASSVRPRDKETDSTEGLSIVQESVLEQTEDEKMKPTCPFYNGAHCREEIAPSYCIFRHSYKCLKDGDNEK